MALPEILFQLDAQGSRLKAQGNAVSGFGLQLRACSLEPERGQSTLEYVVLIAAVVAALVVMSDYMRRSFNAHAKSVEVELNFAAGFNAPYGSN